MTDFNPALFAASVGSRMTQGYTFAEALYEAGCDHAKELEAWKIKVRGVLAVNGDFETPPSDDMREFFGLEIAKPDQTSADIKQELETIAYADIGKFYTTDENGNPVIETDHILNHPDVHAIKSIETETSETVRGVKRNKVKIQMHDKNHAMKLLTQMEGNI